MSFEKFYSLYPRRINKAQALKAYAKAIKQGEPMNNLSTVLSNISNGVTVTTQPANISATLQHGLIKAGGKMTTTQMIEARRPRDQAMANERAKQALQWLRQLKQHRTKRRLAKWNDNRTSMEWAYRSEYALPEEMNHQQVVNGLFECIRPCNPMVVQHFVRLQAVL